MYWLGSFTWQLGDCVVLFNLIFITFVCVGCMQVVRSQVAADLCTLGVVRKSLVFQMFVCICVLCHAVGGGGGGDSCCVTSVPSSHSPS